MSFSSRHKVLMQQAVYAPLRKSHANTAITEQELSCLLIV